MAKLNNIFIIAVIASFIVLSSCKLYSQEYKIQPVKYLTIEDEPTRQRRYNSSIGIDTDANTYNVIGNRFPKYENCNLEETINRGLSAIEPVISQNVKSNKDIEYLALSLLSFNANSNKTNKEKWDLIRLGIKYLYANNISGQFKIGGNIDIKAQLICCGLLLERRAFQNKSMYPNLTREINVVFDNIDNNKLFSLVEQISEEDLFTNMWAVYVLYCLKSAVIEYDSKYVKSARNWINRIDDKSSTISAIVKLLGQTLLGPRNSSNIDISKILKLISDYTEITIGINDNTEMLYWLLLLLYQYSEIQEVNECINKIQSIIIKNQNEKGFFSINDNIINTGYSIRCLQIRRVLKKIIEVKID